MNLAFGWKMLIVVDMCLALYLYFTYIVNVTIRNDSEDNVCIAVSQMYVNKEMKAKESESET